MQKKTLLIPALAVLALGAQAETYFDQARVRSAEPQYESVTVPRQQCSTQVVNQVQQVNSGGERNYGGAVLGGVAGALIGNQVGGGHGREAATALGAVVGAFTGDNLANQNRSGPQYVETPREVRTCQTVNEVQNRITGWRVNYEYKGVAGTTMMAQQPGPTIRVRVAVDPA
ncbi:MULTISPECIES: glycine zipper 2TM domain-containing protein [Ramlibacter]|uniref:Glycine zipper 2TM domain-containing protein n=1 Tax=Ramlibacter aquaticus TaxID=2780094 RepID=A0ABR9SI67_9BURK|nr:MULTISPECIES: glycine zipper 2TM domain-containing protein [Ramlibacter]MBE7942045.1 glycine zipper 2TM domain-containing protein [Ramlibacter aquaticus]